jgi:hypothetical protein
MMTPDLPPPVTQQVPPAPLDTAVQGQLPAPTQEQVQASDQLFSDPADYGTVAGLAGLWTGLLLLHDLAAEQMESSPEEEHGKETRPREEPVGE